MYQLSATLEGHLQDVRDITVISSERVASVSRDGSVRVWERSADSQWNGTIVHQSKEFLNAITYDSVNDALFFGGKESLINGVLLETASMDADPTFTLIGHTSNVCALNADPHTSELVSGSWDKTAKVWANGSVRYNLDKHEASVWDAKSIPGRPDEYVTVCADLGIRFWKQGSLTKTFKDIHTDVPRRIEFIPSGPDSLTYATCSNDTLIKLFNEEGKVTQTLSGHESFVYDIKYNQSTGQLASCGEDRSLRVWDCATGEATQVIRLPAVSIWCVDFLPNNDIIVGCSDNTVRIFTNDKSRVATPELLEQFNEEVKSSSLNSQAMGFDESKLAPPETIQRPGKKEGQIVVVKSPAGALEAHQFSNGAWSKVGEVVGSSSTGSDKKVKYEGKDYDYVFDVDIEEGQPPLKLPVNTSDNPYEAADKFIMRYDLPASYKDQIVNFIITNTTGISLDQGGTTTQPTSTIPPQTAPVTQSSQFSVVPIKTYLTLTQHNPDTILNGIVKLNQKEKSFNDEDIATIGSALYDIDNNVDVLFNYACAMRASWKVKTPAYDIMRIITPKLSSADDISDFVEEGLGSKNINLTMLTVRILVNAFENTKWGLALMGSEKVYNSVFETIDTIYENETKQQAMNLALAVSTLLFNYSVYVVNNSSTSANLVPVISDAANTKFATLEEFQDNEEAAYRLVVTYANLSTVEPVLKQFAKSVKWLNQIKSRYGSVSSRFSDIFTDVM